MWNSLTNFDVSHLKGRAKKTSPQYCYLSLMSVMVTNNNNVFLLRLRQELQSQMSMGVFCVGYVRPTTKHLVSHTSPFYVPNVYFRHQTTQHLPCTHVLLKCLHR